MHKSTVKCISKKLLMTADVWCRQNGRRPVSVLHLHEQFILMEAALNNPALSLEQFASEVKKSTGTEYCLSTYYRTMRRFRFSFKVGKCVHSCTHNYYRITFIL